MSHYFPWERKWHRRLILETNGRKKNTEQHSNRKRRPRRLKKKLSSSFYRSSCNKREMEYEKKAKLPSSHIRSVVLIEARCSVVEVCYCKRLSVSCSHDFETYIKAVAWELLIPSMKYALLKPCLAVKDDASCDTIQALQTFRGIRIILSVCQRTPTKPIFYPAYHHHTEFLLPVLLYSWALLALKRKTRCNSYLCGMQKLALNLFGF